MYTARNGKHEMKIQRVPGPRCWRTFLLTVCFSSLGYRASVTFIYLPPPRAGTQAPHHTHTCHCAPGSPKMWTAHALSLFRAEDGVEGAALGEVYQEAGAGMALPAGSGIRWCFCRCGASVL